MLDMNWIKEWKSPLIMINADFRKILDDEWQIQKISGHQGHYRADVVVIVSPLLDLPHYSKTGYQALIQGIQTSYSP